LASHLHVLLDRSHVATDSAVDAVLRDDDATLESKAFAELFLPELNSSGIFQGGESVIKDYLWERWRMLVHIADSKPEELFNEMLVEWMR
jgi:hypothetical protein